MNLFDICVITASNPTQAQTFSSLLRRRIDHGLYPREIDFRVYSDPEKGRVGSGGGTIHALAALIADYGVEDPAAFFAKKRILMIHAGGESRRLPCYVPEGKLFAPLPVPTSSVIPPVVLDMQLSLFLRYPWARGELVVASGDVVIDFDTDAVPDDRGELCGFAAPAPVEQGARHGVFQFDKNRRTVVDFHQKRPASFLREHALLDGTDSCPIDTGIVSMGPAAACALTGFAAAVREDGTTVSSALASGQLKLDMYLEILTACLKGIDRDSYQQRIAGRTALSVVDSQALFEALAKVDLTAVLTRKTSFLHFGSLHEYPKSCNDLLNKELVPFYAFDDGEISPHATGMIIQHNSIDVTASSRSSILSYFDQLSSVTIEALKGGNMILGLRDTSLSWEVPPHVCIDRREIGSSVLTMVYSADDTFKPMDSIDQIRFCGVPLRAWLNDRGLSVKELWDDQGECDLLTARLFVEDLRTDELPGYWDPQRATQEWVEHFRKAKRLSIREINALDDAVRRDDARTANRVRLVREAVRRGIGWKSLSVNDFVAAFDHGSDAAELCTVLRRTDDDLLRLYRRELLAGLGGDALDETGGISFEIDYVAGESRGDDLRRGVKLDQIVWARSPVRLDLGGGWSDTPPYTLRFGGQVTNVAVDLNGQPPIQVFCRPTEEHHIRIHSIDLGVTETITEFAGLTDYRNPTSPFALPKAAFSLLGLTAERQGGGSLEESLRRLGCGVEVTLLCAVPKGSGLGTSSILGATILAGLQRFFDRTYHQETLFRQVLQMEQMLTTCGGWQDQIGGVAGGVKYIECKPGAKPVPVIHQLDPHLFTDYDCRRHFTLFYTGVTRLAKNILQEVVDRFNRNTPAYLFTVDQVRRLALDARLAIARRDLHLLAETIGGSWRANKLIHPGTTNDEVERLTAGVEGKYVGMKLLGAGGGGYALFISRDEKQADELRAILRKRFEDEKARIVDFAMNPTGLQVSVS